MNQENIREEALPMIEIEQSIPAQERASRPTKADIPARGRVTQGNARLIAFAATFPGASSEAFSVVSARQASNFGPAGPLPTIGGTETRLRKLCRIGALERFKNPATGRTHYGVTPLGIGAARAYGYELAHTASIEGMSIERLTHAEMTAHVAAQFLSPHGFFKEALGFGGVSFDGLVSEHEMRAAYNPIKAALGKGGDFGRWRVDTLKEAKQAIQSGRLKHGDLVDAYPALLTLGQPKLETKKLKAVHQPDMAVTLNDRNGKPHNILVEIELTRKSWEAYHSILSTLKRELEDRSVYQKAVYFVSGDAIANLLKKVDTAGEYGLISSGRLVIRPLLHRDETPISLNRRVSVKGNR